MRNNYLGSKIRRFYSALFTLSLTVVMALVSLCFYTILNNVRISNVQETLDQFVKNVNAYINSYSAITDNISEDLNLKEYLELNDAGRSEYNLGFIFESLNRIGTSFDGIISMAIYDKTGNLIYLKSRYPLSGDYDVTQAGWYQRTLHSRSQVNYSAAHCNELFLNSSDAITLSKCILSPKSNLRIGMVMMDIRVDYIASMARGINYGNANHPFITNRYGQYIYLPQMSNSPAEAISGIYAMEGSRFTLHTPEGIYAIVKNSERNLYAICLLPGSPLLSGTFGSYFAVLGIALFITALIIWISGRYTRRITSPLMLLTKTAQEVRNGNMDVDFRLDSTVEISSLAASLYDMLQKLRESMRKTKEHEQQLRLSELRLLQAQINPHFLYNTLDTIISIAERDGNRNIVDTTLALSDYFRIILSSGSDIITLQDEIQHAKAYLYIQKTRYENLQYSFEVEEQILSFMIPKLLLQPLIENAIYHGIKPKSETGTILVKGCRMDHHVVLSITDNGNGMRPRDLARILQGQPASSGNNTPFSGIGINNIRERLLLYYGEAAQLSITSEYKQYTCVEIRIPMNKEKQSGY